MMIVGSPHGCRATLEKILPTSDATMRQSPSESTTESASNQDLFTEYIDTSTELSRGNVRIHRSVYQAPPDRVTSSGIPEHRISLHISNQDHLERRLDGGKLRCASTYPGQLNFVPAYQNLETLWLNEVELLSLYLPPTLLERTAVESCDRLPRNIELIDRFAIQDPMLEQLFHALYAELQHGKASDRLYIESLQTVLAGHLLRHHCSSTMTTKPAKGGLSKTKLGQVIDYIKSNISRNISLTELANIAMVSPSHFGKLFKQTMGVAPHQYVLQCRIERAKFLLVNSKLSLVEISQDLGFCNQSHFTNAFRRYTQLTPQQYRYQA